ncbi:hypothetical protein F441_22499 [Phytophthora nicotianae CJ01A1]|uniref:Uncharacterized protein n=2 Tax=Phytophthora nicotianae TaxID=4792 RepID=W2VP93_PHYNI|nr:hypothetical protein F441_22499 [Phytophthora nicotianae CJ01A1]
MGKWMTIDNKRALVRQSREAPGMTQTQLAESVQQAFRLAKAPARNTVSLLPWQKAGLLATIRGVEEYDATDADNREEDDSDEEVIDLLLKIAAIEFNVFVDLTSSPGSSPRSAVRGAPATVSTIE